MVSGDPLRARAAPAAGSRAEGDACGAAVEAFGGAQQGAGGLTHALRVQGRADVVEPCGNKGGSGRLQSHPGALQEAGDRARGSVGGMGYMVSS